MTTSEENSTNGDGSTNGSSNSFESLSNENIYIKEPSKALLISRNFTISYCIKTCATILRQHNEIIISGKGVNINIAVSLVEALKREKLGNVESIKTGMDVSDFFEKLENDPSWSQPCPMITFYLKGGEHSKYISGFAQKKVIAIFECVDTEKKGYLSFKQIEELKFADKFRSNFSQMSDAKEFLAKFAEKKRLNLPNFIKYASYLIHPLLKHALFKKIIFSEFKNYL